MKGQTTTVFYFFRQPPLRVWIGVGHAVDCRRRRWQLLCVERGQRQRLAFVFLFFHPKILLEHPQTEIGAKLVWLSKGFVRRNHALNWYHNAAQSELFTRAQKSEATRG
jgi:hypothetical protein